MAHINKGVVDPDDFHALRTELDKVLDGLAAQINDSRATKSRLKFLEGLYKIIPQRVDLLRNDVTALSAFAKRWTTRWVPWLTSHTHGKGPGAPPVGPFLVEEEPLELSPEPWAAMSGRDRSPTPAHKSFITPIQGVSDLG